MKKVIIISDIYKEDYIRANSPCGGAELNDDVLFNHLDSLGLVKVKIHSNEYDTKSMVEFINNNTDSTFLVSNFANLHFRVLAALSKECEYVIYEHDYKFHKYRNPIQYKDFVVPRNEMININFYKKAKEVICLSKLHKDIFYKNLNIENLYNTTCSLWSSGDLEHIEQNSKNQKNKKLAVVDTNNPIKRRDECIEYCISNDFDFDLISSPDYRQFLTTLSQYQGVVILPGHPEPTPRIAVEAKMLNCEIHSNPISLGVAHESWFKLNGKELIEEVRNIKKRTLKHIVEKVQ